MTVPRPFLLVVLDGWGVRAKGPGNAIEIASTPVMDRLEGEYPWTTLGASGLAVGLPEGQMGNSEVGHLNIGAGRLVLQDFKRINSSISSGDFFDNEVLVGAMGRAAETQGTLHLLGLLSDGGVHSHIRHLFALLDMAADAGVRSVATHAFLDGRDVPPRSALEYVKMLDEKSAQIGIGALRTIQGRYYAMDRDKRWDRTKKAYDAIVRAEGPPVASGARAIEESYAEGIDDEFLVPRIVGGPRSMRSGDTVIFFNFRPERPRQLTSALVDRDFTDFDRGPDPVHPYLVTMTEYDDRLRVPVAFPPQKVSNTLADVLAASGRTQLHIAETEKYAHVTYFFNGGVEEPRAGEDRVLIPSPKVSTYDHRPEMSANEVGAETVRRIGSGRYDFFVVNFANCDMVGHTGFLEAAVKAVETVDSNVGAIIDAAFEVGGGAFVTADHGNAEIMLDAGGNPFTAHSMDPVPFINVTNERKPLRSGGALGDIAPTILEVMEIPRPEEMTGVSLFAPLEKDAP